MNDLRRTPRRVQAPEAASLRMGGPAQLIHEPGAGDPARAPALVLVAHGSRDPRHAATMASIRRATALACPGLDVHLAYLDHSGPRVPELFRELSAGGTGRLTAVPMLLSRAFHARVDIPAALAHGSAASGIAVDLAPVLGPDPSLLPAALRAVWAAGGRPGPGSALVLACAGTTDVSAKAALAHLVLRWRRALGADVRIADAAGTGCGVGETIDALRTAGATRVDLASWFLAPGLLLDRAHAAARAAGADSIAAPLNASPELIRLIAHRAGSARPLAIAA
ncbi:MAG: sirohydrochlorin chelatase [Sporichthyaceae bacterium]